MSKKSKYQFLEDKKEEIINLYKNGSGTGKLAKAYGVKANCIRHRLIKWKVYDPRPYNYRKGELEVYKDQLIEDRKSGMKFRFLELKYGVSYDTIAANLKELKGRIPERQPTLEESERLLEDLESELYFLDELSHFYCLTEKVILEFAFEHKCIVNLDYYEILDFLQYEDMDLYQILKHRKEMIF